MIHSAYAQVQIYAFECPKCRRYNLVQSEDPDIYFYCPDTERCGYVIWAKPSNNVITSQKAK